MNHDAAVRACLCGHAEANRDEYRSYYVPIGVVWAFAIKSDIDVVFGSILINHLLLFCSILSS